MRTTQRARKAQRLRTAADRLTTALVIVLVTVAVMTMLPTSSQQRLTALGCRVLTVGLTDCVARLYTPPVVDLRSMPVCEADGVLERMVPTVEVQRLRFPEGGELERWVGRDGMIRVVPRVPEATGLAPSLLAGGEQPWPQVHLLGDVSLPAGGQWVFPGGTGERQFVADLQQVYADEFQSRSAVSLFTGGSGDSAGVMVPTISTAVMPGEALELSAEPLSPADLRAGEVGPVDSTVRLLQDRASGQTATTAPVAGRTRDDAPVQGYLRWSRGDDGRLTEILLTAAWPADRGSEVLHLHLPLSPGDESKAESWLTTSGGILDLSFLAGEATARTEMERLVAAAGTVVLEERERNAGQIVEVIGVQFAEDRRPYGDLVESRGSTRVVRAMPSGGERTAVEVTC